MPWDSRLAPLGRGACVRPAFSWASLFLPTFLAVGESTQIVRADVVLFEFQRLNQPHDVNLSIPFLADDLTELPWLFGNLGREPEQRDRKPPYPSAKTTPVGRCRFRDNLSLSRFERFRLVRR